MNIYYSNFGGKYTAEFAFLACHIAPNFVYLSCVTIEAETQFLNRSLAPIVPIRELEPGTVVKLDSTWNQELGGYRRRMHVLDADTVVYREWNASRTGRVIHQPPPQEDVLSGREITDERMRGPGPIPGVSVIYRWEGNVEEIGPDAPLEENIHYPLSMDGPYGRGNLVSQTKTDDGLPVLLVVDNPDLANQILTTHPDNYEELFHERPTETGIAQIRVDRLPPHLHARWLRRLMK